METARDMRAATGPASDAADRGRSEVEELRQRVKDLTDKYESQAKGKLRQATETLWEHMIDDIEQQIRDRPLQATLLAAGVGFLIGTLLSRS